MHKETLTQTASKDVRETEEHPAPAAAIPMNALLALMPMIKMAIPEPKTEVQQPSFIGEGVLSCFLRQFSPVADEKVRTNTQKMLHLRSQMPGDAQSCGHNDSYKK